MRKKSLFYKLIKCNNCQSNFKSKNERGIIRYVCSNYDNKKGCPERITIEEERLVKLINRRYGREMANEEIREVVVEVIIRSKTLFDIVLIDGKPISFHERGIVF